MTNVTLNLGIENVKGSIIETKGDGKWIGEKLKFAVDVDFSQMTAEDVKSLMIANWKIGFNAKIKPLGEDRVRKFFKEITAPINAVDYLPGREGATAGLFKECYGAIKGLRIAKFTEDKIVGALSEEYGADNVRAVLAGKNPWKAAPKEGKPKAEKSGTVLTLDEIQKADVLKIAKQVQTEMAELDVPDRLDEVVRLCGFSEKLSGIVRVYASQIVK